MNFMRQFVTLRQTAFISVVAIFAIATGCRSSQIDYSPSASLAPAVARSLVLQVIEEQPRGFVPDHAEVSYEKITTNQRRRKTVTYFNSISRMDLYLDRRGNFYFVRVFDDAGVLRLRVWTRELEKGKRFMDGVEALMAYSTMENLAELRAEQLRLEELREITDRIERIKREREREKRRTLELEVEKSDL